MALHPRPNLYSIASEGSEFGDGVLNRQCCGLDKCTKAYVEPVAGGLPPPSNQARVARVRRFITVLAHDRLDGQFRPLFAQGHCYFLLMLAEASVRNKGIHCWKRGSIAAECSIAGCVAAGVLMFGIDFSFQWTGSAAMVEDNIVINAYDATHLSCCPALLTIYCLSS